MYHKLQRKENEEQAPTTDISIPQTFTRKSPRLIEANNTNSEVGNKQNRDENNKTNKRTTHPRKESTKTMKQMEKDKDNDTGDNNRDKGKDKAKQKKKRNKVEMDHGDKRNTELEKEKQNQQGEFAGIIMKGLEKEKENRGKGLQTCYTHKTTSKKRSPLPSPSSTDTEDEQTLFDPRNVYEIHQRYKSIVPVELDSPPSSPLVGCHTHVLPTLQALAPSVYKTDAAEVDILEAKATTTTTILQQSVNLSNALSRDARSRAVISRALADVPKIQLSQDPTKIIVKSLWKYGMQ